MFLLIMRCHIANFKINVNKHSSKVNSKVTTAISEGDTKQQSRQSCGPHFWIELEFGELVSVKGGKPENPEKNPRRGTNNKLNPHVTPGPGIEPGPQQWEASALTPPPSLHHQITRKQTNKKIATAHVGLNIFLLNSAFYHCMLSK